MAQQRLRSTLATRPLLVEQFAAPIEPKDQPLVVQYEVTLTGGLTCGGAYIKVLESAAGGAAFDGASLDGSTPYVIMFGPDKCGDTNKVHFIFRHKNPVSGAWEEKHLKSPPKPKTDAKPHVYTLVVRPTNAFEILIDGKSEASGSLLEDFELEEGKSFGPQDAPWLYEYCSSRPPATVWAGAKRSSVPALTSCPMASAICSNDERPEEYCSISCLHSRLCPQLACGVYRAGQCSRYRSR